MPLRASRPDGTDVLSIDCSLTQWAALKAESSADRAGWRLPCCDARVVAKTSRLGTQFFAHAARGKCVYVGETSHHLQLKALAVDSARAHGWQATTEVSGGTEAEPWIADVLATKGSARVAVEVQWSGQTRQELLTRQERYKRYNIRGLWLIRSADFPIAHEIPAVCVREDTDGYVAMLPAHDRFRRALVPEDWAQQIPASKLLDAAFDGRLQWGLRDLEPIAYEVLGAPQSCYSCGSTITVIHEVLLVMDAESLSLNLSEFSDVAGVFERLLPSALRSTLGIGQIRRRHSRTADDSYLAVGCIQCDALQGEHYLGRSIGSKRVLHEDVTRLDPDLRSLLEGFCLPRWRVLHTK